MDPAKLSLVGEMKAEAIVLLACCVDDQIEAAGRDVEGTRLQTTQPAGRGAIVGHPLMPPFRLGAGRDQGA